ELNHRPPIKDIVFDVGRVLIDFRYDALFRYFKENGTRIDSVHDFVEKTDLKAYEYGHISTEAYLDNLSALFDRPVNREELTSKWVRIFEPVTEMLAWAASLKRDYGVYLLSNTSALHWDYLISEYRIDEVGFGLLASFEVGAVKPEEAIFRAAEKRFGLSPGRTLFIDDLQENVRGAIDSGWRGIHHVSIKETQGLVKTLLGLPSTPTA
ncbi:MAG: HAD family hydrolase, partial [Nitrospiria bacterium]